MEEHVCEWVWNNDLVIPFVCSEPDCRRFLDHDQCEIRLNATERLIVGIKNTHFLEGKNECLRKSVGKDCLLCEAYADILEGK